MKRSHVTHSIAALTLAFFLPAAGAYAATTTLKDTTPSKTSAHQTHTGLFHHASKPKVDLNTASREELMTLPGIDGVAADKIIEHRPYRSTSQLTAKRVVSHREYGKMRRYVTAK